MIEIREVKTRKEIKDFINFPLDLYNNVPYFVPCLYSDEKKLFKKNQFSSTCDTIYYNAYIDGIIVGRISGIIQKSANEKWKTKNVRFTRFDCINNQEVANMLFDKVTLWAKNKGMDTIIGPLGFSDLEREGLLIEGFDKYSTFEEQYNYDYYQKLIENYGFTKDIDWIEQELRIKERDQKVFDLRDKIFARYNLHIGRFKSINEFIKKYADQLFEQIDVTYDQLYGTVPINDEMKKALISGFKTIVTTEHLLTVLNDKDEIVTFAICFPSIGKAVRDCNGKLTPKGIMGILKAKKNWEVIDLGLVGVRPDYLNKGLPVAMIAALQEFLVDKHIEHMETNLNLEDNTAILNLFTRFDGKVVKRRRCFIKKID